LVEAFFKDSENCSDFSYQIKGINNQKVVDTMLLFVQQMKLKRRKSAY
jgi:hypothetical protein